MTEVGMPSGSGILVLDVCPVCAIVWFDPSEFEWLPSAPPEPKTDIIKQLPPEVREKWAMHKLDQLEEKERQRLDRAGGVRGGPASGWQWLPAILGLPVEIGSPTVSRRPWITWATVVACILTTILIFTKGATDWGAAQAGESVFHRWGFIPVQWTRYSGLTLLTSFFMHGGFWHILGNMYFLRIFGDNVEDRLGPGWFLVLLLIGHGTGMLLHGSFGAAPNMPCVGASAGISAVIAFYAIVFPRVRLGIMFRYFLYFRWIRFPAWVGLILYIALQCVGAYLQTKGFSSVSYFGHIGGLAVGLGGAVLYRLLRARKTVVTIESTGQGYSRRSNKGSRYRWR
jgi:membrane associated rhomboid family serine protease